MSADNSPKALLFDVFGTCVDWRGTVTKVLTEAAHVALNDATKSLASAVRLRASDMTTEDWGAFAQAWRNTYKAFTKQLASNPEIKWKSVDDHHFDALKELIAEYKIDGLWRPEEVQSLSLIWHRLDPWQDSVAGMEQLNRRFQTATLSNGNISLLDDLKSHSGIPFTHILSAEMFGSYKPSPKVYLGAAEKLGLSPGECGMVAAHLPDLKAAKAAGYGTAVYIWRPREEDWTEEEIERAKGEGWVDVWVGDGQEGFITAAETLGKSSSV